MTVTVDDVREAMGEDRWEWGDYQPLIDLVATAIHGEVVYQQEFGSYQGDTFVLFKRNGQWGTLVFGWGSCSGCDALQACRNIGEVYELFEDLERDVVIHDTVNDLSRWLQNRAISGSFYARDVRWPEIYHECMEVVRGRNLR